MLHRCVRLHMDKCESSETSATEPLPSSWNDGEPLVPPGPMAIALESAIAQAEALNDQQELMNIVQLAQKSHFRRTKDDWKSVEHSTSFSMFKRRDEVVSIVQMNASIEELVRSLGTTTDETHVASMKGLYGEDFISGSVAYAQERQGLEYHHLAAKTSSFVHLGFLGKNEQWCFAEALRYKGDGFALIQSSLSSYQAQSLPARLAIKDRKRRVAQLRDVIAAYLVEPIANSRNVRVSFHVMYKPSGNDNPDDTPVVSRKAARARFMRFGRAIAKLPHLVRRRRFGIQVFADHTAFDVRNSRCTCCTRRLVPFANLIPRTRCFLCGYYVCLSCSSIENMETYNGRLAAITVCSRCIQSVMACDYEHMLSVRAGPERVLPDDMPHRSSVSTSSTASDSSRSFDNTSSSTKKLNDLLTQVASNCTDNVTKGQRQAAFLILEQLLLLQQNEAQVQANNNSKLLRAASEHHGKDTAKYALDVSDCPKDLDACKFASATSRPYPMVPALISANDEPAEPICYPIPANETARLAAIEHFRLHDLTNIPELNVICQLAAAEMNCPHSVVTLVEQHVVTLLATNAPEYWEIGSGNPREQTFCQHFVMDDQPLLVRHAEADMRFYFIAPVTLRSLRFYAGFPVTIKSVDPSGKTERVVIGALCCLDEKPHEMTRSQYWRLMKLSQAASKILQKEADEYLVNPKRWKAQRQAAC